MDNLYDMLADIWHATNGVQWLLEDIRYGRNPGEVVSTAIDALDDVLVAIVGTMEKVPVEMRGLKVAEVNDLERIGVGNLTVRAWMGDREAMEKLACWDINDGLLMRVVQEGGFWRVIQSVLEGDDRACNLLKGIVASSQAGGKR